MPSMGMRSPTAARMSRAVPSPPAKRITSTFKRTSASAADVVSLAAVTRPPPLPGGTEVAAGLAVGRIVPGVWQSGDVERSGRGLDPERAAAEMAEYAKAGFDSFDMADHYGSAEPVTGRLIALVRRGDVETPSGRNPTAFTKWCPEPGPMTADIVRAGIQRSLERMAVDRIDLLQFHWWMFEHPAYLDAMAELARLQGEGKIAHLGLTNFNSDHLRLLLKQGIKIASNQVCFSLLDRRAADLMSAVCR